MAGPSRAGETAKRLEAEDPEALVSREVSLEERDVSDMLARCYLDAASLFPDGLGLYSLMQELVPRPPPPGKADTDVTVWRIPMDGDPVRENLALSCARSDVLHGVRRFLLEHGWSYDMDFYDVEVVPGKSVSGKRRERLVTSVFVEEDCVVSRWGGDTTASPHNRWLLQQCGLWYQWEAYAVTTAVPVGTEHTMRADPAPLCPLPQLRDALTCYAVQSHLIRARARAAVINNATDATMSGKLPQNAPDDAVCLAAVMVIMDGRPLEVDVVRRNQRAPARGLSLSALRTAAESRTGSVPSPSAGDHPVWKQLIDGLGSYQPLHLANVRHQLGLDLDGKERAQKNTSAHTKEECGLCMEPPATGRFVPCCKRCPKTVCEPCLGQCWRLNASYRKCPFCRGVLAPFEKNIHKRRSSPLV